MLYLDKINDSPKQSYTLVGNNREQINFYLYYSSTQQSWFFDIKYDDFDLKGVMVTVSPNMLRGYKDLIPFGISCVSADGLDPLYITDFLIGRIQLFLLDSTEVEQIESSFYT